MLTEEYIIGLTDGEGSFQIQIRKDRRNPTLRFAIKLRETDKHILDELKSFFGCGKIYIQNDKRPNHSRCFRFEVYNRKEIKEIIIPFFEKNPPKIKSKLNDFNLFKKVTEEIPKENPNYNLINILAEQMH